MNDLIFYGKNGTEITNEDEAFAKLVVTRGVSRYYILTHNKAPYDPNGSNSNREHNLKLVLHKTNKDAFGWYKKYLETNNLLYFTRTNRSFLNA